MHMHSESQPGEGFVSTGLSPVLLSAVTRAGFTVPTPIQAKAIPVALQGGDLIGIAQTGTGKTLAFGLPIIERLLTHRQEKALIIVPTRELAIQVEENLRKLLRFVSPAPRTVCLIGGMPIFRQKKDLQMNPSIIIGTPGRLRDHVDQRTLRLESVAVMVLDEADRMLDMGFEPQIRYLCSQVPETRQTMLFSATLAPEIASLAATYQRSPIRIEVAQAGESNQLISQELCYVTSDGKTELLRELLAKHEGTILVFSRTKHGATKLTRKVQDMGHTAAEIHSNRSLSQRRQALDGFKSGRYRVLVATDVASRGIDVKDVAVVVNYDLPDAAEDYVHRIGRTGRAGKTGLAISFATPDQLRDVRSIERLIKKELELSEHSGPQPAPAPAYSSSRGGGRSFSRSRNFQSRGRSSSSSSRPAFRTRFASR